MLLLTPGPTPVPEHIRQAMAKPTIHHRTPEFETIFKSAREKYIKLFGLEDVLFLASSGTGAMEASVQTFCKSKALTINAGKFGERFGKICKALGKPFVELKYEWDTPASLEDIKNAISQNQDIDSIFIQICESAGGLRHPVEKIAAEIKKINPSIAVVADGITAVGVEPIETKNIDVLICGSQKAFMLPPALAMMGLSHYALELIEKNAAGYYFNLATELKNQRKNTTAYTPATTLIIGLDEVLSDIEKMGVENLYAQTAARSKAANKALEAIGLKIYPSSPALAMNTVYIENADKIRKILKEKYGVNIAGGQDDLKGKIFRINQMGFVTLAQICWTLNAIELTLQELGVRNFDGTANKIFLENIC